MPPEAAAVVETPKPVVEAPTAAPPTAEETSPPDSAVSAVEPPKPKAKDLAAVARERSRQLALKKELEAERHARAAERESERGRVEREREAARAEERAKLFQQLTTDPDETLKSLGADKETFFRRLVNDGKETADERLARLEKLLAERNQKDEERETAAKAHAEEQRVQQAIGKFAHAVTTGEHADTYPYLNLEHDAQEIAEQTHTIVKWAKANGHAYSDEEIAEFLETRAKSRYDSREERRQRLSARLSEPGADGKRTANGHPAIRPEPRTLSNRDASEKATPPRQKTEAEIDAELAAELASALRKDNKRKSE